MEREGERERGMEGERDGWMEGEMDGWMEGERDGWMDGWMEGESVRKREMERGKPVIGMSMNAAVHEYCVSLSYLPQSSDSCPAQE